MAFDMTLSQLRLCHRLFLQDEYKPIYTLSIVARFHEDLPALSTICWAKRGINIPMIWALRVKVEKIQHNDAWSQGNMALGPGIRHHTYSELFPLFGLSGNAFACDSINHASHSDIIKRVNRWKKL
ncbi:hypothetical protein HUJ04_007758 [Dendroctonus ponderosae]|nr:hypothetical protein HUJ04_007758 [Dendroctonus ponderosae]